MKVKRIIIIIIWHGISLQEKNKKIARFVVAFWFYICIHIIYILVLVNTIFLNFLNGNWVYFIHIKKGYSLFYWTSLSFYVVQFDILVLFFCTCIIHTYVICCPLVYIQPGQPVGVHQKKKKKTILSRGTIPCAMTEKYIQKFASKIPFSKCHLDCNWLTNYNLQTFIWLMYDKGQNKGPTTMHSLHLGTSPPHTSMALYPS
jgi:hypothetical protein